jgi:mannosylglycerate hydrolase
MQQEKKIKGLVISHSHWDRAWYMPFESYRHRLVRMTDRILNLLENNLEYKSFMFDGQTILLEDYTGVRPETSHRLRKLISERRLIIGPWYVLPDLFLVSGESVIRNLQAGAADGRAWGGLLNVGYVPDPFGHFAQLPQLLRQFDLSTFMFMRGMPEEDFNTLGSIFDWVAPDGSKVVATYLIDGYFNASALGYPSIYGRFEGLTPNMDAAKDQVIKSVENYAKIQPEPWVVLFNGMDHMPEQPELPQLLNELNSFELPFDLEHSDLDAYSQYILAYERSRPLYTGDLVGNAHHPILKGVWSTRVYIKQENHRLESLITGFLEPVLLSASELGLLQFDATLVQRVWRKLMKNHPHDDICGCSVDDVHFDNEVRFQQVDHMTQVLITEVLEKALIEGIDHPSAHVNSSKGVGFIYVHNPHPHLVTSWIESDVFFPNPDGEDGAPPSELELEAHDGVGTPVQLLTLSTAAPVVRNQFLGATWGRIYTVRLLVTVPATGYTVIRVQQIDRNYSKKAAFTRLLPQGCPWETAIVEWRPDFGDTYSYGPDPKNQVWQASATYDHSSSQLKWVLNVPESRDGRLTEIKVSGSVHELIQGGHSIRLDYTNTASDGRMRILIPLGEYVDQSIADSHFRLAYHQFKLARTPETASERWNSYPGELDYGTEFMRDGVIIPRNQAPFLWLASRGSHEYEIVQHVEHGSCLAVTLHRSVGMLSVGGGRIRRVQAGPSVPVPGAQCLRKITIDLALGTTEMNVEAAHRSIRVFSHPLQARLFPCLPHVTGRGFIPATGSLLSIDNPAVILSTLKNHEQDDCWVVRVYSTSSEPEQCRLQVPASKTLACNTDLHERWDEAETFAFEAGSIHLEIPPHRIVTLLIR